MAVHSLTSIPPPFPPSNPKAFLKPSGRALSLLVWTNFVMSPAMSMLENDDGSSERYQKGVKRLFETGITRVPSKYIFPAQERASAAADAADSILLGKENLRLPIIDLTELQGPNRLQVLKSIANACEQYGFFQLVNHGISSDVVSTMMDVSRRFFGMPYDERCKYMSSDMRAPVRYGTSYNQNNDNVFCWRDFLKLLCHPLPEMLSHWPSSPVDFRKLAATYAKETKDLFLILIEAILESLLVTTNSKKQQGNDDGDDQLMKEFQDGSHLMVVNYYPPCPEPDLTLGIPPHSDYGFLTLVLQDGVEGLQIQHKEKWFTVEPIANSFVVNVGDHLEIFSNGRYRSVLHRVLVNSTKDRISVASLHTIPFMCMVKPWEKLIDEENPKRFQDTNFATFLDYISSCNPKNKSFLDSRRLNN